MDEAAGRAVPEGHGYADGGRPVCEHASVNGLSREWEELYPRLSALPTGASTWLSWVDWVDSDPEPYVPARYAVLIQGPAPARGPGDPRPVDQTDLLAQLPPAASELLTGATPCTFTFFTEADICLELTTARARDLAVAVGMATEHEAGYPPLSVVQGDYTISLVPYLPMATPSGAAVGEAHRRRGPAGAPARSEEPEPPAV